MPKNKVIHPMYQDISISNINTSKEPPSRENDKVYLYLKKAAKQLFRQYMPAADLTAWEKQKKEIYNKIIESANIHFYKDLPIEMSVTKILHRNSYSIQNIYFQTLPNVYATANLYIPKGEGPFPAVINLHGHIKDGRLDSSIQNRAHFLASNGFVCLCMDSFGSGERSEIHGESDYHGSNKGAALLNINETLLGIQISENIRCIDLLAGLNIVDINNIGATGESGGGNQAMWLAAIDERIKAVIPVVSVGTFEAFVMEHNCICELLPDGLTFCEEFQVLGLIAPRALNICNALQETHAAFSAHEMVKTARNTGEIYKLYKADSLFHVQIFNNAHEYSFDMQKAMLLWFNQHLKKFSQKIQNEFSEPDFHKSDLCVFPIGERIPKITTQSKFLETQSILIEQEKLSLQFTSEEERKKLKKNLRINESKISDDTNYTLNKLSSVISVKNICIEWYCNKISCNTKHNTIDTKSNTLFLQLNLFGSGIQTSPIADYFDEQMTPFHTLSRSLNWIGKTVIGEWVKQMNEIIDSILLINPSANIMLRAEKEAGLAVIFFSALYPDKIKNIELENVPISYSFKAQKNYDYYNMSVHLKAIINWGNIVKAVALNNANITFTNARNIHGSIISEKEKNTFINNHTSFKNIYKTNSNIFFN